MTHNNKPFEQSEHTKYDSQAKTILKDIIKDLIPTWLFIRENISEGDDFKEGIWDLEYLDLISGDLRKMEVEMKNSKFWDNNGTKHPFKYPEIDIPERKKENKSYVFCVASTNEDLAFFVTREFLLKSNIRIKKCGNYSVPEPYFQVVPDYVNGGRFCRKINQKWEWC